MAGENGQPAAPPDDLSRAVLACALRCLSAPQETSLVALLSDLTRAFAAGGAGLARLPGGEPLARAAAEGAATPALPWAQRPELLGEAALSPTAVAVRDGGGHWLLTVVDCGERANWLLWLEGPAAREWSPTEAAALALTGQAMARHLRRPDSAPRWVRQLLGRQRQQRFEEAAAVAGRISHDYGNVLTGVLGFSELALAQLPRGNKSAAAYVNEIHRAAQLGERLTRTLGLCARHWPQSQPARLAAVVPAEVRRLAGTFPGARLDVALPADLPPLAIDAEPLRHVLGQLLDNAAEATAAGGNIRLSARVVALDADRCLDLLGRAEPGQHVEVAVEDTGSGLSNDARRRLLAEPFFTTRPRQRGYGLAVAHGILSGHRGGLVVEPAGVGTIARAYLPVAAAVPESAQLTSPEAAGEAVLVVDDDPLILKLVRTTLRQAGYRVTTAGSAEEALRSFSRAAEPFRLVLSDVVMPNLTGYDLARRLRARDAAVNVLFMSGQTMPDPGRPPSDDPPELLAKPFRPEALLRAVRSALERGPHGRPAAEGTGDDAVLAPG